MILELKRTRLAFFDNPLLSPELLSAAEAKDAELPSSDLEEANRAASNIYLAIVNSCSGSAGTFCYHPKLFNNNNITKAPTQTNQQHQSGTSNRQQSGSKNTIRNKRIGQGNSNKKQGVEFDTKRNDLTKELIEKFEKMDFLACSTK